MSEPASAAATTTTTATGIAARPVGWLGAPAPGGLALPAATPTASQLYGPRAVWADERVVVAADTGNHRVLIWHDGAPASHSDADVVLGQRDFVTETANGPGPEAGLHLPTGVLVHDGRLVVADAWNHRVLVWDRVPERSGVPADVVIGQPDRESVAENRGEGCGPLGFYWPFGVAVVGGRFWVTDTGNRRVLSWAEIPDPDDKPDLVLGQADFSERDENRGEVGPASFRWPHAAAGTAERLLIADAGNHRILGWSPPPPGDRPADQVLGQPDFLSASEFPYQPQSATALRFPYAVSVDAAGHMAVADTANNRILLWRSVPSASGVAADGVIGQSDFAANGENRWTAVLPDTLCWPYGLSLRGSRLAVSDSGNNRVTFWEIDW